MGSLALRNSCDAIRQSEINPLKTKTGTRHLLVPYHILALTRPTNTTSTRPSLGGGGALGPD